MRQMSKINKGKRETGTGQQLPYDLPTVFIPEKGENLGELAGARNIQSLESAFTALALQSPGALANAAAEGQPVHPVRRKYYQTPEGFGALLVVEVALKNPFEPLIHRLLAKIVIILTNKSQTVSKMEIQLLAVAKRGLAQKLLNLQHEADRKPKMELFTTPPLVVQRKPFQNE